MASRKRARKSTKRVAPGCALKRAAIGKARGKSARGKALAAYMKCQRAHGIKPRKARRSRRSR